MKNNIKIIIGVFSFLFLTNIANTNAQAFKKGCLLLSLSEGTTAANYSTTNHSANQTTPEKQRRFCFLWF